MATDKLLATNRYSDKDLATFKLLVDGKLERSINELNFLSEQVKDLTESMESEGDWMDDSSNGSELEMLHTMIIRSKRHIIDLENALIRIHNKSFGICSVTGEMIDIRRLMAVPTTTKSLLVKIAQASDTGIKRQAPRASAERQIISKVISKPNPVVPLVNPIIEIEIDDLEEELLDFDTENLEQLEM